jgi:flagellar biosynthesis/type III secretory pathway M-ring protein FliF/YscJ
MVELLNTSYSNLSQRLRDLSAGARLTILFLLLLVLASIWIMLPSGEGNEEYLFGGREFSSLELANMEQAFATANLNESRIVGSRMRIPRTKKSQYLASLQGVFEPKHLNSDVDDVLKENDWWGSSELRKLRLKNATEKDLSRTIAMMPGIEQAKVSIDESVTHGFQKQIERTALAAVKPVGSIQLAARTAESIREVVSARYTGLERDRVTVIDLNSGEIFGSSSPQGPWSVPNDPYVILKRYYEREWRSKIQDMVSMIPSVKVQVNVVLEETDNVNHQQQQQPESTLVPIRGIASIAIPRSYYRMIQKRRQDEATSTGSTPAEPTDLEVIEAEVGEAVKKMVVGLLPNLSAGNNPYPQVQVSSYLDFPAPSEAIPTVPLVVLSDWLTANWRPVALGTLGLLALIILTVRFRRREQPIEAETEQPADEPTDIAAPMELPSPSLRDELAQLVQEEPDSVVETISRWLKDAA